MFPCREAGARLKQPYTEHGHHDATTQELTVRAWWSRWPGALVAISTGPGSGLWVLDVDGPAGHQSLNDLLSRFGLETARQLSRVIVKTPSGGLHLYFKLHPGERPWNRAKDIGAGLDTRGVKADGSAAGYIIAPGSALADGRGYRLIEGPNDPQAIAEALQNVQPAPRGLLYLATFNRAQRHRIKADPALLAALREAATSDWQGVFDAHQLEFSQALKRSGAEFSESLKEGGGLASSYRRQAIHDLTASADGLANLSDGRRAAIFAVSCGVAKYVGNDILTAAEVQAALSSAWAACGGAAKYGQAFAEGAIRRALDLGRNDPLPPLARQFRGKTNSGAGAQQ